MITKTSCPVHLKSLFSNSEPSRFYLLCLPRQIYIIILFRPLICRLRHPTEMKPGFDFYCFFFPLDEILLRKKTYKPLPRTDLQSEFNIDNLMGSIKQLYTKFRE